MWGTGRWLRTLGTRDFAHTRRATPRTRLPHRLFEVFPLDYVTHPGENQHLHRLRRMTGITKLDFDDFDIRFLAQLALHAPKPVGVDGSSALPSRASP